MSLPCVLFWVRCEDMDNILRPGPDDIERMFEDELPWQTRMTFRGGDPIRFDVVMPGLRPEDADVFMTKDGVLHVKVGKRPSAKVW